MFNFKDTEQKVHSLESKYLELEEDRESPIEIFNYVKSEEEHNQKAVNLVNGNTFVKEQQSAYEAQKQKAVEFKAKALFELEQVIIGIEQFKQICQ